MRNRTTATLLWLGIASIVILVARWIAYALNPDLSARLLEQRAGGPGFPTVVLVSLTLGVSVAVAVCWLVALGVRERALLERRRLAVPVPPFRAGRAFALAVAVSVATSLAGGMLEAYLHWRAGLGWHGVHCLLGPVHRNLIPIEAACSVVAVALTVAGEHVAAWMRRTFALLRELPPTIALFAILPPALALAAPPARRQYASAAPRGPPAFS
jgi:hypothetical protein